MEISVAKLLHAFLQGLRALTPIFESVALTWKNDEAYDPWENTAAALFQALIGSAVENASYSYRLIPLPKYDARLRSYATHSYLSEFSTLGKTAFVCFETKYEPFDYCLFANLDNSANVVNYYTKKTTDVEFSLIHRSETGDTEGETLTITYIN